jgi:plasmid replication initiation protein
MDKSYNLSMNTETLRNQVVVKSNAMINALGALSLQQTRFVAWVASSLPRENPALDRPYDMEIDVSAFAAAFEIDARLAYAEVRKISRVLQQKIIPVPVGPDVVEVGILTKARYRVGEGRVWLRIDEDLLPHILGLKEQFTRYRIKDVYQFASAHTWRVYELLRQFKDIGKREIDLDEFKQKVGVSDRYRVLADLRKRVLDPAILEINATSDIQVQYDQKKKGRRVVSFLFIIRENQATKTPRELVRSVAEKIGPSRAFSPDLVATLREYRVSPKQALQLANLAIGKESRVLTLLPKLKTRWENIETKKTSLGGYVFKALVSELGQSVLPL